MDGQDALHLIFKDGFSQLRYATNRSGEWKVEALTASATAVDRDGNLHIVQHDFSSNTLRYGRLINGKWAWESFTAGVLSGGDALQPVGPPSVKLVIDANGKAHVAWWMEGTGSDRHIDLRYASNAAGGWQPTLMQTVSESIVDGFDLVIDEQDRPHLGLAYTPIFHGTRFCLGTCDWMETVRFVLNQGTWQRYTADSQSPLGLGDQRYALEKPSGVLHSVRADESSVTYAIRSSTGVWSYEPVVVASPPPGRQADMAIAQDGTHHVSSWNEADNTLEYATDASGAWVTETALAGVYISTRSAIAVHADRSISMALIHPNGGSLMLLRRVNGQWAQRTVAASASGKPSMGVDAQGRTHLVYADGTQGGVWMHATDASGVWVTRPMASVPSAAETRASLNVSPSGLTHVCLSVSEFSGGATSGRLTEGLWVGSLNTPGEAWQFEQVTGATPSAEGCAIHSNSAGQVAVAYLLTPVPVLSNQKRLMFSRRTSSGWQSSVVASGILGAPSLMLDTAWGTVITYVDGSYAGVNQARWEGTQWVSKEYARVYMDDGQADSQLPTSLDSTGLLSTLYFDLNGLDLNLVKVRLP